MPYAEVQPVFNRVVRGLCTKPYPGHPRGCPNFNKKPGCPLAAPLFWNVFDVTRPVVAIWNVFDLGAHVARMQAKHPDWSERQLVCCYYWQGAARSKLNLLIANYQLEQGERRLHGGPAGPSKVVLCPEAMGVNVTATMRSVGVELEWPPKKWAVQVALAAEPK